MSENQRRRTRDVRSDEASIISGLGGGQFWIYDADGLTAIGTCDENEEGFAIRLDDAGLALVIAELSRRLHGMLAAALPVKDEVYERPLPQMSLNDAREELTRLFLQLGHTEEETRETISDIETGEFPDGLLPRGLALAEMLRQGAINRAETIASHVSRGCPECIAETRAKERPISEMSRDEIRSELGQALRGLNIAASDAIRYMDEIESGVVDITGRVARDRCGDLAMALAQKAAAPT